MFKVIKKRDGREVPFDETKITDAIFKAARAVGGEDRQTAMELTIEVLKMLKKKYNGQVFGVEDVQDVVEKVLIEAGHAKTAKAYILYRDKRTRIREAKSDLMDAVEEILEETSRENANISNSPSAKMLQIASAASKKYYLTRLVPEDLSLAHQRGDIHIHDLDFYGKTLTCVPDFEYTLIRDTRGEARRVKFAYFNQLAESLGPPERIEGSEVWNVEGYQILGRKGWTPLNKIMRRRLRGGECLYRIRTRKGLPLHLTGEHKVPVFRDGQEILVQAKDIRKKDKLLQARQRFDEQNEIPAATRDYAATTPGRDLDPLDVVAVDEVRDYDGYVFDLETGEHWFTVNDYVVHNCIQIPLGRLLAKGFDNGHGYIRPPKRPTSATALAAIILQSSQNDMHGGQSFAFFDRDIAPYVENASEEETYQAMEALVYNLNSMHSRAGAQVPFSSINVGTETSEAGRKVTRNLILAYEAGLGRGENPIFPNIIFRVKEGVNLNPGDPNYDLFKLAIRTAAKRLNPTFSFMDSSFNKEWGDQVSYMGCRTRVMANRRGPAVTDGRGNLSFTTINLPRVAIKAERNLTRFYQLLDDVINVAIRQLYHRFEVQAKLKVKDMPFVMGQKLYLNSEHLKECDPIRDAIVNGTLSVGFIGLAETLVALTGRHHGQDKDAQALGQEIVAHMRRRIDEACEEYDLNYTLLATPAEGLSGRFVGLDRKEYGIIPGVTDKEYYTNSFHVPVGFPISSYDKIKIEGVYHKYCNAGHISYVEMASPPVHNPEAMEAIIRHMKDCDMGYAAVNFPVDFCTGCNTLGVINEEACPRCGSTAIRRVRRITGYLSTVDRFNDSKLAELNDRVVHDF